MGLLDDAIREHLELKRLHGADPDEVAREESAAFDPVRGERDAEPEHLADPEEAEEEIPLGDGHVSDAEDPEDPRDRYASDSDDPEGSWDGPDLDADDPPEPESRHAIQETAEIDMRTILEAEELEGDATASRLDREPSATPAAPARARRSLLRRRRSTGGEADPL
jgi:hypothetical protein